MHIIAASESPFEERNFSSVPVNRLLLYLDAVKSHLENIFPSYLSPFTSLSRVTPEPNFSHDYIIFSLCHCSLGRLFLVKLLLPKTQPPSLSSCFYPLFTFQAWADPPFDFLICKGIFLMHQLWFDKESSSKI